MKLVVGLFSPDLDREAKERDYARESSKGQDQ